MLKGKKVLVTGAGGFIGSHMVEYLLEKGAGVRAFVKYNGRGDLGMLSDIAEESRRSIEIIFGNICDPFFVRKAVDGCDYVFHLAALCGIPYSYVAPQDYVSVNIGGTVNVLEACRGAETPRMVATSTSETYGTAQYIPIDEKHPLRAQSPYAASKIGQDKIVESYHESFGMPVVTVKFFNTFGPRQSARAFIPTVIAQALTRDKLRLGALEPVRDMTYVRDSVEGYVKVGLCDDAIGREVNLGVGSGSSVGDIAKKILKILGKENMSIELDPRRVRPASSEVMRLISDNTVARNVCGWKPRFTLEEGLVETIEWIKRNISMYRPDEYVV